MSRLSVATAASAVVVIVAVAFILASATGRMAGGEKGGPPSDATGPPVSVDAEAEALLPRAEGEDLSDKGPGPGVRIRGEFVPIPAEATLICCGIGDAPVGSSLPTIEWPVTVIYRNSRVTFRASDGVTLERTVDRADEQALAPLLEALGQ